MDLDGLPRKDISAKITPNLLKDLGNSDWKVCLDPLSLLIKFWMKHISVSNLLELDQPMFARLPSPVLLKFLEYVDTKKEMVHRAIDGMWQVFKLQHSTPKNDFCRIAVKNDILIRLVNTLYSLNEATRLASIARGGLSITQNGLVPKPRSGPLDPHSRPTIMQGESPISDIGHTDTSKLDHPFSFGSLKQTQNQAFHSQRTDGTQLDKQYFGDGDKIYPNHAILEASKENGHYMWDHEPSRGDADFPRHHGTSSVGRSSIDKAQKHMEFASNGHSRGAIQLTSQNEQIWPLLKLSGKGSTISACFRTT